MAESSQVPLVSAGAPGAVLATGEIAEVMERAVAAWPVRGRRVLVLVPDRTRSAPLPLLRRLLSEALWSAGASALTWLVALGTHRQLLREELGELLGTPLDEGLRTPDGAQVRNHAWREQGDLLECGTLDSAFLAELAAGVSDDPAGVGLGGPVPVRANAAVAEHDLAVVLGPVFPHEVVGFSGGNKYFFPGISSPEMIDASHWLGALITSREIIGTLGLTPVRRMIDRAASLLPIERRCLAFVVAPEAAGEEGSSSQRGKEPLCGLYGGTCEEAWQAAAALSAAVHVRRLEAPVPRVVAVMPTRYEDMWTAAKGMYKLEPVVADGGELVIYAPHIAEISSVHGEQLAQVGYHCRDYFLGQWDRFRDLPKSVLAHSTHLRGQGTYDPEGGIERCRVQVTLATGIDEATCKEVNLGYLDPAGVDLEALASTPGTLVVPHAGEVLYRLAGERPEAPPA